MSLAWAASRHCAIAALQSFAVPLCNAAGHRWAPIAVSAWRGGAHDTQAFRGWYPHWRSLADAAGSKSSSYGQPPSHTIKAIPWAVTPEQAQEAYQKYHSEKPIYAPPRQYLKSKQVFLPFWAVSGKATVEAVSAQVGFSRVRRRLNPATRAWENETYVEWVYWPINQTWERRYAAEQVQMYAGSKYNRADIDVLKPLAALADAVPMKPDMIDERDREGKTTGRLRRVYPFTVTPDTALKRGLDWIREQEEASVRDMALQSNPGANQVSNIQMDIRLQDYAAHPVFVPAYVFTLQTPLLKLKMRTFVGGYAGAAVAGTHMYDGVKVGAIVAAVTPIALLLLGIAMPWTRLFWIGSLLPGTAAGLTAHYFADLRSWWEQVSTARRQDWEAQDHRNWDAEWVKGYSRLDSRQQQEQRQWRRQQQGGQRRGWDGMGEEKAAGASPGDSKGYYQVLGVERNASTSEIQAAFRAAALKYHPDRYTGETDKQHATVTFQRISNAYSTLRDPQRRKQYDLT